MKMTLLQMTQDILSAMDSDEVNSISDTVESMQVANIVRRTYYDILSRTGLPDQHDLFELNPSNDNTKPTLMYRPASCIGIDWVKYQTNVSSDADLRYSVIEYLHPKDFFDRQNNLNVSASNVISFSHTINSDTMLFVCLNDKMPEYYTSFDDNTMVFDSYDSSQDTTLMKNKTMCYGVLFSEFEMEDSYIPDLDPREFSLLYNKAEAKCFAVLKQMTNASSEREERRQWISVQKRKQEVPERTDPLHGLPNYGRRGRGLWTTTRLGRNSW